jgi:DNA-binding SARP family transcriptional activator
MILPTARGERIGKYHAEHDLIEGLILLKELRPIETQILLTETEKALKTTGMKLQQIQANLLIAACHLKQDQMPEMLHRLEEVGAILTTYECYEQRIPVELRPHPALSQVIKMLPEAAHLRALFHLGTQEQEHNDAAVFSAPSSVPAYPVISGKSHIRGQLGPTHIRIQAFGEPIVILDEQPVVRWRMARAMELFFYLLDSGRPLRKEQIIAALWPEAHEQMDHIFHNTIYYVRKAIGVECLVFSHNMYTLELTSRYGKEICYDVARFEACSTNAQEALARKDEDSAVSARQKMIDLYRSDYLLPFYSDWCSLRRDTLRTAYLDAHLYLAQYSWRSEAFDVCAHHWQQIVAADPCREEAHAGLIRCYLRQGKRGLAWRQYIRCRETLQQELNIEPGPGIQRLYQHLSSAR